MTSTGSRTSESAARVDGPKPSAAEADNVVGRFVGGASPAILALLLIVISGLGWSDVRQPVRIL
jgi:hypothetical protein